MESVRTKAHADWHTYQLSGMYGLRPDLPNKTQNAAMHAQALPGKSSRLSGVAKNSETLSIYEWEFKLSESMVEPHRPDPNTNDPSFPNFCMPIAPAKHLVFIAWFAQNSSLPVMQSLSEGV